MPEPPRKKEKEEFSHLHSIIMTNKGDPFLPTWAYNMEGKHYLSVLCYHVT
jgi:hypothetical protein